MKRLGRLRLVEILGTVIVAVALRITFLASYPTGWDDVDFALALQQFDMSRMQPHFPGYPIYILCAHLFYAWLHEPFLSLSLLSALAGGLTIIPLWLLFSRLGSMTAARLSVWIYLLAPLPAVLSIQPMSDSFGAFLVAWLAYFAWRAGTFQQERRYDLRQGGRNADTRWSLGGGAANTRWLPGGGFTDSWWLLAAGITLGLLFGVRVSYLAMASLWIWAIWQAIRRMDIPIKHRLRSIILSTSGVAIVCLIWLSALIVSEGGVDSFLTLAVSFTEGHFNDWGGTYLTDASLLHRAQLFIFRQVGGAGFGTVWDGSIGARWIPTGILVVGILGLLAIALPFKKGAQIIAESDRSHRRINDQVLFLLIWILPYLIWAFFAQNIEKPRHVLPILPPMIYMLVKGLRQTARIAGKWQKQIFAALAVIWLAGTASVSIPLLQEAHNGASPMLQLAAYMKEKVPVQDSLIFTWEEQRVLQYAAPSYTAIRLRKWEDFQTEVLQYEKPPARIFATNALLQGFNRPVDGLFYKVAEFQGNPWVYPTYHTIVLYQGTPLLYDQLQKGKGETSWKSKHY